MEKDTAQIEKLNYEIKLQTCSVNSGQIFFPEK